MFHMDARRSDGTADLNLPLKVWKQITQEIQYGVSHRHHRPIIHMIMAPIAEQCTGKAGKRTQALFSTLPHHYFLPREAPPSPGALAGVETVIQSADHSVTAGNKTYMRQNKWCPQFEHKDAVYNVLLQVLENAGDQDRWAIGAAGSTQAVRIGMVEVPASTLSSSALDALMRPLSKNPIQPDGDSNEDEDGDEDDSSTESDQDSSEGDQDSSEGDSGVPTKEKGKESMQQVKGDQSDGRLKFLQRRREGFQVSNYGALNQLTMHLSLIVCV